MITSSGSAPAGSGTQESSKSLRVWKEQLGSWTESLYSPFSFSPNMVRKTVKLMGPLASFIIASSSSFFTLRRPGGGQGLEPGAGGQGCASHKLKSAHSFPTWADQGLEATGFPLINDNRGLTHGRKCIPKILLVNNAIPILINYRESLWRGWGGDRRSQELAQGRSDSGPEPAVPLHPLKGGEEF